MSHEPRRHHPSRTARAASIATAIALAVGTNLVTAIPARAADPVAIQLLGINDFHGRIWSSPDNQLAGAMVGKVNELRAENPNTVFVSSGDNIGASTFESFIADDNPTIDVLNAGGLDVSAVGNHEFDQGFTALLDRIPAEFGGVEDPATDLHKTEFPYLGANVYARGTQTPVLPEYFVIEKAGVTLGFVGLVTAETYSLVSPSGIANLDFGDPLAALNRVAGQLSDGNAANGEAEVIVALLHDGSNSTNCATIATEQTNFGNLVRGASATVDVIFSAHTHMAYACEIAGRPVIQSGSYAANLASVVLSVDPDNGSVQSATPTLVPLLNASGVPLPSIVPDPAIVAIVDAAVAAADVIGARPVGSITADIRRAFTSATPPAEDRGSESSLGSLVADMQLWATSENPNYGGTQKAVMAFMNPGGLRADLVYAPDGVVTYKEAALVQPFANTLVTMDLTGAQIRQVLEEQWQPAGSSRPKLHLGISADLSYTYDPSAPRYSHIQKITFRGKALKESATYRVVVNSFLASGGDNFTTLGQGTNKADSGQIDLQAAVEYFEAHPQVSPPALGRAVPVAIPPASGGDLTDANTGPVELAPAARPGDQIVVTVGTDWANLPVEVWLFSKPVLLYAGPVASDGTVTVTLPAGTKAGKHKVAVFDAEDVLIGWGPVTVVVSNTAAVNLVRPGIVGDVRLGSTVSADPGTWWPAEGLSFRYQWKLDGRAIKRATSATYRIQRGDVGRKLSVEVTATSGRLKPVSATSAAVKVAPAPLVNVSLPKILGKAASGRVVVAHPGKWSQSHLKYSFQWKRDGKAIKGATRALYRIGKSDVGKSLTVTVTAKAQGQPAVAATSRPVKVSKR